LQNDSYFNTIDEMETPEIYKFKPILKSVLWGGDKICKLKNIESDLKNIGESWEISGVRGYESVVASGKDNGCKLSDLICKYKGMLVGENNYKLYGNQFPLLVKIIDAKQNLSLQVHPNDELAAIRHNSKGKTEMWYVIEAEPKAELIAGFQQEVKKEEFSDLVRSSHILDVVSHYSTKSGDAFFIPAGLVHGIGAGNLIVEVQQTSDVTYRIYDYNRRDAHGKPRQLHIDEARDAIKYSITNAKIAMAKDDSGEATDIVKCPYFNVKKNIINSPRILQTKNSFLIVIAIEGNMNIYSDTCGFVNLTKGETVLIPASVASVYITGSGKFVSASC
jgi:mannose-6-phosphate isomerase